MMPRVAPRALGVDVSHDPSLRRAQRVQAIVPVRGLTGGKSRLATVLDPSERDALVAHLLARVVHTLVVHPRVTRCIIASPDPALATWASRRGAHFALCDGRGLNPDLAQTMQSCSACQPASRLIVAADLPWLDASAIDRMLDGLSEADVVIARSRDAGTNALAVADVLACPPAFGPGSALRHARGAEERGRRAETIDVAALAFDIDSVADASAWAAGTSVPLAQRLRRRLRLETAA